MHKNKQIGLTSTLHWTCIHPQGCIRCTGHWLIPYGEVPCNVPKSLRELNSYGAVYGGGGGCCGVCPFRYLQKSNTKNTSPASTKSLAKSTSKKRYSTTCRCSPQVCVGLQFHTLFEVAGQLVGRVVAGHFRAVIWVRELRWWTPVGLDTHHSGYRR